MIWRLTYCNKDGVEARLDIIRGASTPVEVIEGTATPFVLNYKLDKPDKSGHVMSSSADISIFETPTFNIDNLKTSSETEIKVEHYINSVLDWSGFVIPDFFSKTIGTPSTVEMVASDRLGTLKGVTLDDLNQYVSMRDLAVACLAKTGLSLQLYTLADFGNAGQTNAFFKALGLSGRLSDTKGRNISCYDILKSILVASNSKLVQQDGAWYIVNKFQHEQGAGNLFSTLTASTAYSEQTVSFSDVHVGARRTIIPVAATTGVFHEFGGGRSYPDNFDFRDGQTGWTTAGTFIATIDNREITGYDFGPIGATTRFGDPTDKNYLLNKNVFNVANYIQSADIDVPYDTGRIEVVLDINAIGPRMSQAIAAANLRVSVGATSGSQTLWLNTSGVFQSGSVIIHNLYFSRGVGNFETANFSVKGVLEQPSGYNVFVRIYGSNEAALDLRETAVNFATISFNNTIESPKGLIYRRNQGTGFTKEHDIDTSIFGDYMRKGLDGYFYEYRIDDTSSLYSTAGTLTEPLWTAHGDTEQLPLLRHVTRQKSRMFSVAHNMISARIDVATFKPLNIFVDCNSVNPRHVVVSATYDFLRSEVEVELEQIAYTTLDVREYIYSYFGDGESGISSVGGIASGSGGGGVDTGIIGGINDKINEVEQRMDDIKVGVSNLLRNTGFLGDFNPMDVDAITAVTGDTPINTNPLAYWVHSGTTVIDAPSRSGKGVKIGSIQQTVTLKQGSHVLSFWAKGNSLTVDLVESVPVSIDSDYKKYSFDITVANSGAHTFSLSGDAYIYEIMLSEGNADVSYSYSEEDDLKSIAQLQAINVITDAIKNYDTDILGGLILTSMIQLGKYKDGVMERVNAGISGIYNNDNDPAVWAGGTMEMAIRTVQKFISNPNYQPTEAEWADMAKIVFTHGGDGFFRGYIYALGGFFRGKIESNVDGNRIIVNPENRSIEMINSQNRLSGQIFFSEGSGWGAVQFYDYHANGTLKTVAALDLVNGVYFSEYADGNPVPSKITYSKNGQIQNGGIPNMTDAQADTLLVSGEWYRDGRTLKIKP